MYKDAKMIRYIRQHVLPKLNVEFRTPSQPGEYLTHEEITAVTTHLFKSRYIRPNEYIRGDTEDWKLLFSVEMKFNRLVAYPTWQLHSLNYQPEWFGIQLDQRRLTHNLFISWPKPK